jgi:hypothetical protein
VSRQFEFAERLQTWKCEDLNAEIEPDYIHIKCNEIILWRIYTDDCATGPLHKCTWYDKSVFGQTAMTILDNNMDKGMQCDQFISGLAKK